MFHKPTIILFYLSLSLVVLLSACSKPTPAPLPATPTPVPMTFTDGLKRTITLSEPAQKIVSLAASNTEILFAIGAGDQVVGRDEFSDYPPQARDLPSVGGSFGGYNSEAIVALQPDLILAAEINTAEQVKTLADLGLTVYLLPNPTDMEGMYGNLITVAQMTGHEAEAQALVNSLRDRVVAVKTKVAPLSFAPTVFYEMDATDPNAPYTAGPGNFVDLIIVMAGGINIGSSLSSPWAQISAEALIAENPQVIILGDAAYGITPDNVKSRAGWEVIDAVKNNQVFPFDDNLISRPGPRMVDGLEALAKILHPEVFK